jgi:hypothetical protein
MHPKQIAGDFLKNKILDPRERSFVFQAVLATQGCEIWDQNV